MNSQKIRVHPPKFFKEKFRRVNIFISGRVQRVFFRSFTKKKAQELGLFGLVKNLPDGRVEVLIEGDKEKIDKILTYLKQGPPLSKVENIEINYEKYQGEFKNFSILLC